MLLKYMSLKTSAYNSYQQQLHMDTQIVIIL
jgi:hypothetical protein